MNTMDVMKSNAECMTASPMPQYQSHKKVWALKIKKVHRDEWGVVLVFAVGRFAPRAFTNDQLKNKPDPQNGWYFVTYKDGYMSFSPAAEFEEGYSLIG